MNKGDSMYNALGIIAYNDSNVYVEGLEKYRPIAAFSFIGRYRLVDFPISNMTNSGMNDIDIYVNGDPKVMFEHLGSGRQYNINSKHGHLGIVPVFPDGERAARVTDVATYYKYLYQIEHDTNDYVVIAPVNYIYKANYAEYIQQHVESGADVSILYQRIDTAKEEYINCDVLDLNTQKGINGISLNLGNKKNQVLSLQTYIMSKVKFVDLIKKAHATSAMYWFKDVINDCCEELDVRGINYRGNIYPIYDLKSYFDSNMRLLSHSHMKDFSDSNWPIYTKTNDSAPTIYMGDGCAVNSLVSNGCEISGEIKGSIIGRNVIVGKGAVIENCLILPGAEIAANAVLKNVIVDKNARIVHKKEIIGSEEAPIYINRRETV